MTLLEKLQKQKIPLQRILALNDFEYFFNEVLGKNRTELSMGPHHKKIFNLFEANKETVVIAPRGHGKSVVSTAYLTWVLWRSKKPIEILIVSATEKQSVRDLSRIKNWIESIPLLREDLFEESIASRQWAALEIKTKNGSKIFTGSFSVPKSIRSKHVDYVLLDDILEDEANSWEKAKRTFWEVVYPIVQTSKGKLMCIGTPMSFDDLLHDLTNKEKCPTFNSLHFQAVDDEWTSPLWPEKFTIERLKQLRSNMGSVAWSKEYMCNPVSAGTSLFPYSIVKPCLGKIETEAEARAGVEYYFGADIALSDKESADFSVFTILKKEEDVFVVARRERYKGMPSDSQEARIKELQNNFRFRKGLIERQGLSISMADALVSVDKGFPTVFEVFQTNRTNKEKILSNLEIALRNKALLIDESDSNLIEELLQFGIKRDSSGKQTFEALGKHDDSVISLALALEAATSKINTFSCSEVDLDEEEFALDEEEMNIRKGLGEYVVQANI